MTRHSRANPQSVRGIVRVSSPTPVFQLRFAHGWITVDAAMDREIAAAADDTGRFLDDRYAHTVTVLRRASLIVIAHEHYDHIGTVTHPVVADELAPKTMLTRAQMESLLHKPKMTLTPFESTRTGRYIVVDSDRLLPIAPGVVLKALGHTPHRFALRVVLGLIALTPTAVLRAVAVPLVRRFLSGSAERDVLGSLVEELAHADPGGYIGRLHMLLRYDVRARLAALRAPTLVVAGSRDRLLPSAENGRYLAQRIPGAALRVLPDAGHACLIEPGVDLAAMIRDWRGIVSRTSTC